jgi:hypothetical protein
MKNGANLNKDVETHIGNKQTPFGWLADGYGERVQHHF